MTDRIQHLKAGTLVNVVPDSPGTAPTITVLTKGVDSGRTLPYKGFDLPASKTEILWVVPWPAEYQIVGGYFAVVDVVNDLVNPEYLYSYDLGGLVVVEFRTEGAVTYRQDTPRNGDGTVISKSAWYVDSVAAP